MRDLRPRKPVAVLRMLRQGRAGVDGWERSANECESLTPCRIGEWWPGLHWRAVCCIARDTDRTVSGRVGPVGVAGHANQRSAGRLPRPGPVAPEPGLRVRALRIEAAPVAMTMVRARALRGFGLVLCGALVRTRVVPVIAVKSLVAANIFAQTHQFVLRHCALR